VSGRRNLAWWPPVALVAVLLVTGLGVGLGVAQSPRPEPFVDQNVLTLSIRPGQIVDFGINLPPATSGPFVLEHISLIPVAGWALPVLRHAEAVDDNGGGDDLGWPPSVVASSPHGRVAGFRVTSRSLRHPVAIWVGVVLRRGTSRAAFGGLSVTYRLDGVNLSGAAGPVTVVCLTRMRSFCDSGLAP